MQEFLYLMQFRGRAVQTGRNPDTFHLRTFGESCTITTTIDEEGIRCALQPVVNGRAVCTTDVEMRGEAAFVESGVIEFGAGGHRLHIRSVREGHIGQSANPRLQSGSVTYEVERGEGQFQGATGLITSNFLVDEAGEVTEFHCAVLQVR
ncbi:MAG: hypothetical protein ACK5AZ_04225 [Bryobacteraceae bacterium]